MTSVAVAYLHPNKVSHSFMDSFLRVLSHDQATNKYLKHRIPAYAGPDAMDSTRNFVVQRFLDASDCEWLWFVDTDMGFPGDALDRLISSAHPTDRRIVGGMYFTPAEAEDDGLGGIAYKTEPVVFGWGETSEGEGLRVLDSWPENSVFQVSAIGTGFMLIHRSLLEEIRETEGDTWFSHMRYANGTRLSEDLSFCLRSHKYGSSPYVDTGIPLSHHKEVWLTASSHSEGATF